MIRRFVVFAIFTSSLALAALEVTPLPIDDRFSASKLVVRVLIKSVKQPKPWPIDARGKLLPADCSFVASVLSIYKGGSDKEITVSLARVDPMEGVPVARGELVLFLNRNDQGRYVFALDGALISLRDGLGRLRPSSNGISGMQSEVARLLTSGNEETIKLALGILLQFRRLAPERIAALKGMTFRNLDAQVARLAILSRFLPNEFLPDLATAVSDWNGSESDMIGQVGDLLAGQSSTKMIDALERIAVSISPHLRTSAMRGLRRIKSAQSIPFLIRQLDFSDDREVQYLAIITLAETTDTYGEFAPGMGVFDKDPNKYVELWKQWWANHKDNETPKG